MTMMDGQLSGWRVLDSKFDTHAVVVVSLCKNLYLCCSSLPSCLHEQSTQLLT